MENKKEIREELQRLSPLLARLKEVHEPPTVPKTYFADMQAQVWRKWQQQQALPHTKPLYSWWEKLRLWWLSGTIRPALAVAALALLVTAGLWWWYRERIPAIPSVAQLSEKEVLDYIQANTDNFDTQLLLSLLPTDEVALHLAPGLNETQTQDLMDAMLKSLDTENLEKLY